jgi:exoribonuclease R
MYKAIINDRQYSSWSFLEIPGDKETELSDIHPFDSKLFSNDVFSLDETTKKPVLIQSPTRHTADIPGVLILLNNKTYGRYNKTKLFYKCIPDDTKIPSFLIPYEMKNMGFSKVFNNLYVTFSFTDWREKHPHGVLNQVFGPVDAVANFYEYQMVCKHLNESIQKLTKDTSKALQAKASDVYMNTLCQKYPSIEDRTLWKTMTIDPGNSKDLDDAIGIRFLDDKTQQLTVYISNVTLWIDALQLWDSLSDRVSTIYLPDKKRPMLPTLLSEGLCSLLEKTSRFALAMDLLVEDGEIKTVRFVNCKINVYKNYEYEEAKLMRDPEYKKIGDLVKTMVSKNKYLHEIKDSHDVISYLMILMNYYAAKELIANKTGILRSAITRKNSCTTIPSELPGEISDFIKIWKSTTGQYIDIDLENENTSTTFRHDVLDLDAYTHITSPIRRLVDLLNMIQIQKIHSGCSLELSAKADLFYKHWIKKLDYINKTMRAIRNVQSDCGLLHLFSNDEKDEKDKHYVGFVFDKTERANSLYEYSVYLPELRLVSKMTCFENLENYERKHFRLFLFHNEEKFKKKIRLQLL